MNSVCIVIATFNAQRTLHRCLETIFDQDYPKAEVIIVDGGSTDKTIEIAKKYKVKVIIRRGLDSESSKAVGLLTTKADVYCDMAADNYLPDKHFVKKLMEPINNNQIPTPISNEQFPMTKKAIICGSYPERYFYDRKDSLLNRYFALMGVNDPVAYYLGKADRKSYLNQESRIKNQEFRIVDFNIDNMPTLGANGFFIKRKLLLEADIKHFYHIDVVADIIKKVRFAVVNITIGHDTGETIFSFLKKRRKYFEKLYLKNRAHRRYHLYDPKKDFWKLVKFIIYSLTLIEPLWLSIRGYKKVRDIAWFLHPVICFLTVWNYGISISKSFFK